jgi:hypothetical protein
MHQNTIVTLRRATFARFLRPLLDNSRRCWSSDRLNLTTAAVYGSAAGCLQWRPNHMGSAKTNLSGAELRHAKFRHRLSPVAER